MNGPRLLLAFVIAMGGAGLGLADVPNGNFETASPLEWTLTDGMELKTDGAAIFGGAVDGTNYISTFNGGATLLGTAKSDPFTASSQPSIIRYSSYSAAGGLGWQLLRTADNYLIQSKIALPYGVPAPGWENALVAYPFMEQELQIFGADQTASDYLMGDNFREVPIRVLVDDFESGQLPESAWEQGGLGMWLATAIPIGPWPAAAAVQGSFCASTKYSGSDNNSVGVLQSKPVTVEVGDTALGYYLSTATAALNFDNLTVTLHDAADDSVLAGPQAVLQAGGIWYWQEFDLTGVAAGTEVYVRFNDNDTLGFMVVDFVCVLGSGDFVAMVPETTPPPINYVTNGNLEDASPAWTLTGGMQLKTDGAAIFGGAVSGSNYVTTFAGSPDGPAGSATSPDFTLPDEPQVILFNAYSSGNTTKWALRRASDSAVLHEVVALAFGSPSWTTGALIGWPHMGELVNIYGNDPDTPDYLMGDNFRTVPIRLLIDPFQSIGFLHPEAWDTSQAGDWDVTDAPTGAYPDPVPAHGEGAASTRHDAVGNAGVGILQSQPFTVLAGDICVGYFISQATSSGNFDNLTVTLHDAANDSVIVGPPTPRQIGGVWYWQELSLAGVTPGTEVYVRFTDNDANGFMNIDFVCVLGTSGPFTWVPTELSEFTLE
ncbi:MAG TPA: hypothetical protein PK847_06860 [Candidatus Sumerlaeota bacterium]|nr:hypothetical protein [Candidatus Sumerlaeota bacterium]